MRRRFLAALLALASISVPAHSLAAKAPSYAPKTVAVQGYVRKDGTHVAPYFRSAPNPTPATIAVPRLVPALPSVSLAPTLAWPAPATPASTHPQQGTFLSTLQLQPVPVWLSPRPAPFLVDDGRVNRSSSARRAFMVLTGFAHGRPGYIIDHVVPLACGGADAPSNMQWQTVAEAKAKDKWERRGCR